ncbi:hypothetical protein ILYODFUR_038317 [Ilyodon furcidens]|uniref:Uncharacterized protein n=1 Tax=Ilyodon furcidens TaxID=33524 RepID=A0ABV0STT5_9TELE
MESILEEQFSSFATKVGTIIFISMFFNVSMFISVDLHLAQSIFPLTDSFVSYYAFYVRAKNFNFGPIRAPPLPHIPQIVIRAFFLSLMKNARFVEYMTNSCYSVQLLQNYLLGAFLINGLLSQPGSLV